MNTTADEMSVEDACRAVLGDRAADAITQDQGHHWTFFAAVTAARTTDDPRALAAIRSELKRIRSEATP